jgi:quinol monooxygenase YgiN
LPVHLAASQLGRKIGVEGIHGSLSSWASTNESNTRKLMYAVIRTVTTHPDWRDELAALLREFSRNSGQPICFLVGKDATRNDRLVVTELWQSCESRTSAVDALSIQESLRRIAAMILDSEVIFEGEGSILEASARQ